MNFDDDETKQRAAITLADDLSPLSVEELTKRIELLQQEISRVETEILNKKSTKSAAENVFKL